jgi:YidC/Oxa1 family membrane protein insertase
MNFLSARKSLTLLLGMLFGFVANPVWATDLVTEQLQLSFGQQGQLVSAVVCHPDCTQQAARRLSLAFEPGLVSFAKVPEGPWHLDEKRTSFGHELTFEGPGESLLRWTIPAKGYGIELLTLGLGEVTLQAGASFRAREAPGFGEWLEQVRYLAIEPGNVRQIGLDESDISEVTAEWMGFRSRFWAVLITADRLFPYSLQTGHANLDPVLTSQGAVETKNLQLYLGPVERSALGSVDELLPDLMYAGLWFWLRWICIFLALLLGWIQSLVSVWGLAIMIMSACVGFMMLPLTRIADSMQQQVNRTEARLAPELTHIKKEFKGEEQAAKIIALYKTERVHPLYSLKSLLGVAVVIPVFIGAFDMLAENIYLMNTSFLWVKDLSRPDELFHLPIDIPFFGTGFNLLPWVMTGLSIWASLLHKPLVLQDDLRQRQVRNMILLAAAFFVLFYTFPAGMVLYWTTNNLIAVGKGLWASWVVQRIQVKA